MLQLYAAWYDGNVGVEHDFVLQETLTTYGRCYTFNPNDNYTIMGAGQKSGLDVYLIINSTNHAGRYVFLTCVYHSLRKVYKG